MTISTAAVIGAGYMGGGIAQVLTNSNISTVLADASPDLAEHSLDRLKRETREFENNDLFDPGSTQRVIAHLSTAASIEDAVQEADYIAEAVPEIPSIKAEVHARIDAAKRPDAIVGSNTSTIRIESMAPAFTDPSIFLGVHFSNPAPFIPGVEVIAHPGTSTSVTDTIVEFIETIGKTAAQVKDNPGFVLNRLQYVMFKEAIAIVQEGIATAEDVDTIVSSTFGFRTPFFGPFVIADMAGLDIYKSSFDELETHFGARMAPPKMLSDLVAAGKLGTKSGGGFTNLSSEETRDLIAYRNEAYAKLSRLLADLRRPPTHSNSDHHH